MNCRIKKTKEMFRALDEGLAAPGLPGAWLGKLTAALDEGADPDMIGYGGVRPLWHSSALRSPEACSALLNRRASVVESPRREGVFGAWARAWGRGVFGVGTMHERAEKVFELLLAAGAPLDKMDRFHPGKAYVPRALVGRPAQSSNVAFRTRQDPWHRPERKTLAASMVALGDFEAAKLALDHGARLDKVRPDGGSLAMECLDIERDNEAVAIFGKLLGLGLCVERHRGPNGLDILAMARSLGRHELAASMEALLIAEDSARPSARTPAKRLAL